jgi:hypothetical protein
MSRSGIPTQCGAITLLVATFVTHPHEFHAAGQVDTTEYHALAWRSIGPFRGGRSVALEGAVGSSVGPVTEGERRRHDDLAAEWARHPGALERLLGEQLAAFNALYRELEVPAVLVGR